MNSLAIKRICTNLLLVRKACVRTRIFQAKPLFGLKISAHARRLGLQKTIGRSDSKHSMEHLTAAAKDSNALQISLKHGRDIRANVQSCHDSHKCGWRVYVERKMNGLSVFVKADKHNRQLSERQRCEQLKELYIRPFVIHSLKDSFHSTAATN